MKTQKYTKRVWIALEWSWLLEETFQQLQFTTFAHNRETIRKTDAGLFIFQLTVSLGWFGFFFNCCYSSGFFQNSCLPILLFTIIKLMLKVWINVYPIQFFIKHFSSELRIRKIIFCHGVAVFLFSLSLVSLRLYLSITCLFWLAKDQTSRNNIQSKKDRRDLRTKTLFKGLKNPV